ATWSWSSPRRGKTATRSVERTDVLARPPRPAAGPVRFPRRPGTALGVARPAGVAGSRPGRGPGRPRLRGAARAGDGVECGAGTGAARGRIGQFDAGQTAGTRPPARRRERRTPVAAAAGGCRRGAAVPRDAAWGTPSGRNRRRDLERRAAPS